MIDTPWSFEQVGIALPSFKSADRMGYWES